MRVEDIFYGDPFASELTAPTNFMGGVAVPEPQQQQQQQEDPLFAQSFVTSYQDALQQGGGNYDDVYASLIGDTLSEQGDLGNVRVGAPKGYRSGGSNVPQIYVTPENYIKDTGAPAYLTDIFGADEDSAASNQQAAQGYYSTLSSAGSPEEISSILSEYYGTDFVPASQELGSFGGKSPEGAQSPEEFHSFIEPILKEQIPFLQFTRGISYTEALETAFIEDPMLQALYATYGVSPIRQTPDGSTYLYDPFGYGEIRTKEVKDNDFGKALEIATLAAASYFAPQLLLQTGMFGAPAAAAGAAGTAGYSAGQLAAASAAASAATTAAQGGDLEDALTSALLSGARSYATPLITETLDKAGLTSEFLDKYGVAQDDLVNAVSTSVSKGVEGASLEESLIAGIGTYLKDAGVPGIETPEFVAKTEDFVEGLVKGVGDIVPESVVTQFDELQDALDSLGLEDAESLSGLAEEELAKLEEEDIIGDELVALAEQELTDVRGDQLVDLAEQELANLASGGALRTDPSILRDYPVTERRDTAGNLLFSEPTPQRGSELESWRFGSEPVEPVTVDVQEAIKQLEAGGGGSAGGAAGSGSAVDAYAVMPPETYLDTPVLSSALPTGVSSVSAPSVAGALAGSVDAVAPLLSGGGAANPLSAAIGTVLESYATPQKAQEKEQVPPPPPPTPTFTKEQVDKQIADAVAGATQGLLTQEQADAATQEAIASLPEDTTLFDQGDIDTAVAKAVGKTTTTLESDFATERTGLESAIEGLEGELTTAGTAIESLETKLETANTTAADLESKLETSQNTSSELKTTLESTQTALEEQKEITKAKEADIESLTTSVNTLTGTVSDLSTKLTEVTAAKDKAIEDGDKALADAMEQAEKTLQTTKTEAQETLDNAIAAGDTKAADAVAAGQAAVADAVATGEAALASAVAKGEADTAAAVAAGKAAAAAGREEGFGEGQGQGRGEGFGAGTGLGLALGAGIGMLQPQTVTKTMFEDFEFEKKYEAPEMLAGLKKPPVYKAPEVGLFQGII